MNSKGESQIEEYVYTPSYEYNSEKCNSTRFVRCSLKSLGLSIHFQQPSLFYTDHGYYGGNIISMSDDLTSCNVLFNRDELGNEINKHLSVPVGSCVVPYRENKGEIFISTSSEKINAEGYLKAGYPIYVNSGIGSGINSCSKGSKNKYPIYNPLTFHNLHHRNALTYTSFTLVQIIEEYLQTNKMSSVKFDQSFWLINTVLLIDNHSQITKELLLEAIINFCVDYSVFPKGTLIRQPINYIFDILGIDGVYSSKISPSVSFIPTNMEGITYK